MVLCKLYVTGPDSKLYVTSPDSFWTTMYILLSFYSQYCLQEMSGTLLASGIIKSRRSYIRGSHWRKNSIWIFSVSILLIFVCVFAHLLLVNFRKFVHPSLLGIPSNSETAGIWIISLFQMGRRNRRRWRIVSRCWSLQEGFFIDRVLNYWCDVARL